MNKKVFTITFGIITFIAALVLFSVFTYGFYEAGTSDYDRTEDKLAFFGAMILSLIVAGYVKLTNFGNSTDKELTKVVNEKMKLKELIEIAELEKKLKEIKK